jgi:hypothetical protein
MTLERMQGKIKGTDRYRNDIAIGPLTIFSNNKLSSVGGISDEPVQ